MKPGIMTCIAMLLAAAIMQANMVVNSDFLSAVIENLPSDNLDPDGSSGSPADRIDTGWGQNAVQFAVVDGAGLRNRSISSNDSIRVGMGQVMTAEAGLGIGDDLLLSFDQTVVDSNGNSFFGVYVFGFVQNGADTEWETANGDNLPTRNAHSASDNVTGNYSRYRIYADTFTSGAENVSTSIALTRDYDYYGIVFQGEANTGDSWTIDNVFMGSTIPEPATIGLLSLCALTVVWIRRRQY